MGLSVDFFISSGRVVRSVLWLTSFVLMFFFYFRGFRVRIKVVGVFYFRFISVFC